MIISFEPDTRARWGRPLMAFSGIIGSIILGQIVSLMDTISAMCVKVLALQSDVQFPILQYAITYFVICIATLVPFMRCKKYEQRQKEVGSARVHSSQAHDRQQLTTPSTALPSDTHQEFQLAPLPLLKSDHSPSLGFVRCLGVGRHGKVYKAVGHVCPSRVTPVRWLSSEGSLSGTAASTAPSDSVRSVSDYSCDSHLEKSSESTSNSDHGRPHPLSLTSLSFNNTNFGASVGITHHSAICHLGNCFSQTDSCSTSFNTFPVCPFSRFSKMRNDERPHQCECLPCSGCPPHQLPLSLPSCSTPQRDEKVWIGKEQEVVTFDDNDDEERADVSLSERTIKFQAADTTTPIFSAACQRHVRHDYRSRSDPSTRSISLVPTSRSGCGSSDRVPQEKPAIELCALHVPVPLSSKTSRIWTSVALSPSIGSEPVTTNDGIAMNSHSCADSLNALSPMRSISSIMGGSYYDEYRLNGQSGRKVINVEKRGFHRPQQHTSISGGSSSSSNISRGSSSRNRSRSRSSNNSSDGVRNEDKPTCLLLSACCSGENPCIESRAKALVESNATCCMLECSMASSSPKSGYSPAIATAIQCRTTPCRSHAPVPKTSRSLHRTRQPDVTTSDTGGLGYCRFQTARCSTWHSMFNSTRCSTWHSMFNSDAFAVGSFGFYFFVAFLDVQAGTLCALAFSYTNLASCCLIDWISLLMAFLLSVQFMGVKVTRWHVASLLTGFVGSLCILASDSGGRLFPLGSLVPVAAPSPIVVDSPTPTTTIPVLALASMSLSPTASLQRKQAPMDPVAVIPDADLSQNEYRYLTDQASDLLTLFSTRLRDDRVENNRMMRRGLREEDGNRLVGDSIGLLAAAFFGITTVMMERALVAGIPTPELLFKTFLPALIICVIEFLIFEARKLPSLVILPSISWIYLFGGAISMSIAHVLSPTVLQRSSSAFYNLSLLSSAGLAILLSALVFGDAFPPLYSIGLIAILGSLFLYHYEGK